MDWLDWTSVFFLSLIFGALIAFSFFVNWTVRNMRDGMTEEERKRHDEEITRDLRIW